MIFQNHYSDATLISYLDGELSGRMERRVQKHLQTCWKCRTRAAELEQQVHELERAFAAQTFPGPSRIDAARRRLFERCRTVLEARDWQPLAHWSVQPPRRIRLAPALAAAACVVALGLWFGLRGPAPEAVEIVAGLQEFERAAYSEPAAFHQVFRVEMAEIRPRRRKRVSRVEIWSDPGRRRHAARWEEPGGELLYAVWRPDPGRRWVYDRATAAGLSPAPAESAERVSIIDLAAQEPVLEQLEAAFLRWLRSGDWRPVRFGSAFYAFSRRDGVALRVEPAPTAGGGRAYRLSALQASSGRRVELVVEVDAETYRPRLQYIRFETAQRAAEVRFVVERSEAVRREFLRAAVFEPDPRLRKRLPAPRPAVRPRERPATRPRPAAELERTEMALRYLLHQHRSCLGEPVEVVRESGGRIRVRGVVRDFERKAELLTALAELQAAPFTGGGVEVEIRAIGELIEQNLPPEETVQDAPVRVYTSRLPIRERLAAYLRKHPAPGPEAEEKGEGGPTAADPGNVGEAVTRFSNRVISLADGALAEAWALRRLAERYGSAPRRALGPESRWLLEVMVRDHMAALVARGRRVRGLLGPVLAEIGGAGEGPESGAPSVAGRPPGAAADPAASWSAACLQAFQRAKRMHELVHRLFAGEDLPEDRLDAAVGELAAALLPLDREFSGLEEQLHRELARLGRRQPPSARPEAPQPPGSK